MSEELDRLKSRSLDYLAAFSSSILVLQKQRQDYIQTFEKFCQLILQYQQLEKQARKLEPELKDDEEWSVLPKIKPGDLEISKTFLKATARSIGVKL